MPNLHTPERQPDETLAQYRARQAASREATRVLTLAGLGQHRNSPSSRERQRDAARQAGRGPRGSYGLGLLQPERRRQQQRMARLHPRDENGAVTLTGSTTLFEDATPGPGWFELGGSSSPAGFTKTARRIWLAGISAQRGF